MKPDRPYRRKTHCPNGHPYTPENTYVSFSARDGKNVRNCRACKIACDKRRVTALHNRVIEFLGNKCVCCGETEHVFLTVDHINGGGSKHFRERPNGRMFKEILQDPEALSKYRCLCMNCNWAKRYGNYCPHELKLLHFVEAA